MAHWPLWQSNGTKNTSFQESSPESSPVQNPGPVQGIVLPSYKGRSGRGRPGNEATAAPLCGLGATAAPLCGLGVSTE